MTQSYLRDHADGYTLTVRAQPGAKKTAITGIYGEGDSTALKIAVQAAPIEGRANDALIAFLARTLNVPKASIALLSGDSSRSKVFLLKSTKLDAVRARLSELLRQQA